MKADENPVIENIKSEELMAELKIPQNYKIVAPLIFGFPRTMPQTPEKRDPVIFWH